MNADDPRFGPRVPLVTYWPRWASAAILASGIVVVAVETTSWLVLLGLAFLALGAYGLLVRGRVRSSTPTR